MADRKYLEALARRLADEGRLIEAGWVAFRLAVVPAQAGPDQLNDVRIAFMSGAGYLFSSMMTMFEEGSEETPADLSRMDQLNHELELFEVELARALSKGKTSH